jgi:hypothetical protein
MTNNEVKVKHTVRKDAKGNALITTFTRVAWMAVCKQQIGNYARQGRWEEMPETVATPPEAGQDQPKPKGRPRKK